ncbi:glycosyltransferase [Zunongwangia endophytica]|uniref:Glycosyltransferase n=1 Tax=Zunongwangia endophytica TaxID=1808945 RepID=A0ABV8H9M5_9FLAO|nr:glycosyltransferase [Zunongwangia endophytica]MDN3595033.1 glycosyltransferase [Zunongwangia endophytica]
MPKKRKILMVSMPSLHFFRWVDQLKDSDFEVYWFDITGAGNFIERISWVHQITNWKLRWNFPGRIFLKSRFPQLYQGISKYNERTLSQEFEKTVNEIQPDTVHSFALYVSCTPILSVMKKHTELKWIYSSWGSDLFYFQNNTNYLADIKKVLKRVNYLITDCKRDFQIAEKYGFRGQFLGVFPGGGGFKIGELNNFRETQEDRKLILIKGYQGRSGRAVPILKAISKLTEELQLYKIVIFGADPEVFEYLKKSDLRTWDNIQVLGKIPHDRVLKLMGSSKIYIGNSNSDGMPNTLLEAICMDVFPIQSNPGNVTSEIIEHGKNGLLISDCDDVVEIISHLKQAITTDISNTYKIVNDDLKQSLDFENVKNRVLKVYKAILN